MTINYEADAQAPADSNLTKVSSLANELVNLETEIEKREADLSTLRDNLKFVQEIQLPEAMAEVGLTEFKLKNGAKVTVKPYYSGKIDDNNRAAAFEWLRGNGHGDLIKHELNVAIGRDEKLAQEVKGWLERAGITYNEKEGVHFQTLAAFIREQVESGTKFPLETFNAYIGRKAKVTQPK